MRAGPAALASLLAVCLSAAPAAADNLTYHGDTFRSGWDSTETALTPSTVKPGHFGQRFTYTLDSVSFGQPLVADGVQTPSGTHNLVIVATMNDTVYALDTQSGAVVWQRSLVLPGTEPVPWGYTGCQIASTYGVVSTPVINRTTNSIYVVGVVLGTKPDGQMAYHLYELSLSTGKQMHPPRAIQGSLGTPYGTEKFNGSVQTQRPALAQANGQIYVSFGSICDYNGQEYHGWVFAFDQTTLAPSGVYNVTPAPVGGGYLGGIWMNGDGPAVDNDGSLFFVTGNGTFDNTDSFGDSVVHISPAMGYLDSFTPYTVNNDNSYDLDFGSGGIMLLPDNSAYKDNLAVAQGKDGVLTLMNRAHLGGYTASGPDNVLAELQLGPVWSSPAFFEDASGGDYVFTTGGPLYKVSVTRLPLGLKVAGQTSQLYQQDNGNGSTPTISSNGKAATSAIAWIVQDTPSSGALTLYAYAVNNLAKPLYSAGLGTWCGANAYLVPTVDSGSVFVEGCGVLYAFGLTN